MADYEEMYFKMFRASEKALNILIAAQRECEELYISAPDSEMKVVELSQENKKGVDEE